MVKILIKIVIPILVFILLVASAAYLLESSFYILGKISYPLFITFNKTIDLITKQSEKIEDTIVYCDYYCWHDDNQWSRGYSNIPLLGFYSSLDPKVINKHIEWSENYGIDVLKIEYIPQFDETITNGIMKSDIGDRKICLMYDSRLRFESIGYKHPPYNFDDERIAQTFISDINHIADTYFDSNKYFRINGRPVLWIYVARDFCGNYKKVIKEARDQVSKKGYDMYLIGDVVFWNYRFRTINAYDAISCYTAYAGAPDNTAKFAERLKLLYLLWNISSRLAGRDFIPAGIPAYDDSCLGDERLSVPPLSGTADEFRYQLAVISGFLDNVNIKPDIDQVTIATFNEHQEGSSVEPAEQWGFLRIEQIPVIFGYD
jgi:hypothetical protein